MDYNKNTLAAAQNLGAQLAESIEAHHFAPQLGQVWAALFIAGPVEAAQDLQPLLKNMAQLQEHLDELLDLGAVRQDEQGRFIAETDPLRLSVGMLRAQEIALVEELQEALDFAADKLKAAQDPQEQARAERVTALAGQIKQLHQLLKLINKAPDLSLESLLQSLAGKP